MRSVCPTYRDLDDDAAVFSPALAQNPVYTARAAIAAENQRLSGFPPSLYSSRFISTFRQAIKVGPWAETLLCGIYTKDIRILNVWTEGYKVQARVKAKIWSDDTRSMPKYITKTITFFMAPDGRIDDFDPHIQDSQGQNVTALTHLRKVLASP